MIIGSVRHNATNAEGKTIPDMRGVSASGCTVNYGTWNDYYYCEFEKNTMASYSEDYQFSRVPHSELNFTDTNGNGIIDTVEERDSVTGCKHDHTDAEDKQAVYLPFHQLFTGYSWGVSSIGLEKYSGIVTDLDITEGDQEESVEKFETKFTGDFLYRVGNQNTVSLDSLFKAIDGVTINGSGVYVTIDKVDENTNVSGIFKADTTDWTKGTIQFSGTGVVKVTIQDYNYCTPTELYLEVVDAKNVTTASFSGNTVLLNDVKTSNKIATSGIVYGNGFTVDMTNGPIKDADGAVFLLYDGAVLKNLGVVGKEFTTVSLSVNNTDYGVSAIRAYGRATIENCYISGCRSAVYATGTELTIKDSVIANGVYANIDFAAGILNLHNVTTINEPHDVEGTTVVGLGVVGNMTASTGRQINVTGTLKQYNWVSQEDCDKIKTTGVSSIYNSVFSDDKYASYRYTYKDKIYANTGILSLNSDFGASAAINMPSEYEGMDVSATILGISAKGYAWSPAQAGTLTDGDMQYHDKVYVWTPNNQSTSFVPSSFAFSNAGLEADGNVVQISYESGSSYTLSADTIKKLLPAKKYGIDLSYTVSMNGIDYTDKDIVFDAPASQTYTITYTITDNLVYDKTGMLTTDSYEVSKDLKVFTTVVDKSAEAPAFKFYYGTKGSASAGTPHTTQPTNNYTSTIKQIGDTYYIMPNVNTVAENSIGSQTVNGETVYYPIVDGINVRSGSMTDYDFTRHYPVFKAVTISDNGTEYSYSTTTMPDTVVWESATIDSGNGASALNDGFSVYNNQYLCKSQKKAGNAESGGTSVVKYSYTALDGNTYYYYVGYRFYDESESSGCVTPDTLVTLADGTQKQIKDVTYEDQLLVRDFYSGQNIPAPASIVMNHGADEYKIVTVKFSDGTSVNTINGHGFYDVDEREFVILSDNNAEEYLGHSFAKADGKTVKLVNYSIKTEYTESWSVLTAVHYNCVMGGMWTLTPAEVEDSPKYLMPFEINEDMTFDQEAMYADIQKYGMYTYEEFQQYVTPEQFYAFNFPIFKVAVGKGYFTYEDILYLISIHFNVEIQEVTVPYIHALAVSITSLADIDLAAVSESDDMPDSQQTPEDTSEQGTEPDVTEITEPTFDPEEESKETEEVVDSEMTE